MFNVSKYPFYKLQDAFNRIKYSTKWLLIDMMVYYLYDGWTGLSVISEAWHYDELLLSDVIIKAAIKILIFRTFLTFNMENEHR
jgi:hypothetical protein